MMIKHDWTDGDKWYDRWRSWKPEEIIARKQNKRSEARLRALADNRCVVGFYRYELGRFGRPSMPTGQKWDLIGKAMDKLEAYRQTGNKENLVDAYNYIRWEWTWPGHVRAHFAPQDQGIEGALGRWGGALGPRSPWHPPCFARQGGTGRGGSV